jgi:hypothetical protein
VTSASARRRAAGAAAALLWILLGLRWFDAAAGGRPAWLERVPPIALASGALLAVIVAFPGRWRELRRPSLTGPRGGLLLVVGLAALFRLPLAGHGAAGYVTPDGALSGIVALHVRDGTEHLVFVPHVPYSGSLKSHLTAPLAAVGDPARAFALVSVAFYAGFVAALYRLALLAGGSGWSAMAAGLYAAFAPAFVTRYSLSNDGNYVEVLALGAWALVTAARWGREEEGAHRLSLATGILLGLAFWCHILAVIHAAAVALWALAVAPRRALRAAPTALLGFVLGDWPGLLWNAANGWESFQYLRPGRVGGEATAGVGVAGRAWRLVADQALVLLGYDPGYPSAIDVVLKALAILAVAVAIVAIAAAAREAWRRRSADLGLLLVFTAVNVLVALLALPLIEGNPRYLQFLMAPLPIFMALLLDAPRRRWLMALLVAFGAAGSLAQVPGTVRSDDQWRHFVGDLEKEGVKWCETDFHLATKINFLSQERVVCSAKLGPVTTEYFFEYRRQVDAAPAAALVAVNSTAAEKLERRLERLGVSYERRDFMKPVLLRLSRKVEPEELFPGREFPLR